MSIRTTPIIVVLLVFLVILINSPSTRAIESASFSHCEDIFENFCRITFVLSHPRVSAVVLSSFHNRIHLPFDLTAKGITVTPVYPDLHRCDILHSTAEGTVMELAGAFSTYISTHEFFAALSLYADTSRVVDCLFHLPADRMTALPSFPVPTTKVELNSTLLQREHKFKPLSITEAITTLPAMIFHPGLRYPPLFNPTNGATCEDQFDPAACRGDLVFLPTQLFPLVLNTTMQLDFVASQINTSDCPLEVTQVEDGSLEPIREPQPDAQITRGVKRFVLRLSSQFFPPSATPPSPPQNVACKGLVFHKAELSHFTLFIPSPTSPALVRAIPDLVLYSTTKIKLSPHHIGHLADCYDHTDSRCTFFVEFSHPQLRNHAYLLKNIHLQLTYLHDYDYILQQAAYRTAQQILLSTLYSTYTSDPPLAFSAENNTRFDFYSRNVYHKALDLEQQIGTQSWLSEIYPSIISPMVPCEDKLYYRTLMLNTTALNQGRGFAGRDDDVVRMCYTMRKSLQSSLRDSLYEAITPKERHTVKITLHGDHLPEQDFMVLYENIPHHTDKPQTAPGTTWLNPEHVYDALAFHDFAPVVIDNVLYNNDTMSIASVVNYTTDYIIQNFLTPQEIIKKPKPRSTTIFTTPMVTYTTPVEVIWDTKSCQDPNSQFCTARYRSRHVGGPLAITLSQSSRFLRTHEAEIMRCNSINMDLDSEEKVINFPALRWTKYLASTPTTTAQTDNVFGQEYLQYIKTGIYVTTMPYSEMNREPVDPSLLSPFFRATTSPTKTNNSSSTSTTTTTSQQPHTTASANPLHFSADNSTNPRVVIDPTYSDLLKYHVDLYDPIHHLELTYHECIITYFVPYSTPNITNPFHPHVNHVLSGNRRLDDPALLLVMSKWDWLRAQYEIHRRLNNESMVYQELDALDEQDDVLEFDIPASTRMLWGARDHIAKLQQDGVLPLTAEQAEQAGTPLPEFVVDGGAINPPCLPTIWDTPETLTHDLATTTEARNFLIVEQYVETSLLPRPNLRLNDFALHETAHIPILAHSIRVNITAYHVDTRTWDFEQIATQLMPRYNTILLEVTSSDQNCNDRYNTHCTIHFAYPSYTSLGKSLWDRNPLRSFSFYLDGFDDQQIGYGDFSWETSGGLFDRVYEVTSSPISWNELNTLGARPLQPEDMPEPYKTNIYVTPPQFNPNKLSYTVFHFNLMAADYKTRILDESTPEVLETGLNYSCPPKYLANPNATSVISLRFRKQTQFYFHNYYSNARPALVAWGRNHTMGSPPRLLAQPPHWHNTPVPSEFQPDYALQFDEVCLDSYHNQCRVFIHRKHAIPERWWYTIDLWSFSSGEMYEYHPDVVDAEGNLIKIYYADLPAEAGTIVPLSFPVRPLDSTATSASIQVVQFADPLDPVDVVYIYLFFGRFIYDHPPAPVLGEDCTVLAIPQCSITYTMGRGIYMPMMPGPFIVVTHNLTSLTHFFVDPAAIALYGNETLPEHYVYTVVPEFEVYAAGVRSPALEAKLLVTITGNKHPAHYYDPLTVSVMVNNVGQRGYKWFYGHTEKTLLQIVLRLTKTANTIHRALRTRPMVYQGIPLLGEGEKGVAGIKPLTFPRGLGYRPFQITTMADCQTAPARLASFRCTLLLDLAGNESNPVHSAVRILPAGFTPSPAVPPTTILFHSIRVPSTITPFTPNLREQYKEYECANFTQYRITLRYPNDPTLNLSDTGLPFLPVDATGRVDFTIPVDPAVDNDLRILDRFVAALHIAPAYHHRTAQCFATLVYDDRLESWQQSLLDNYHKVTDSAWLTTAFNNYFTNQPGSSPVIPPPPRSPWRAALDLYSSAQLTIPFYINQNYSWPIDTTTIFNTTSQAFHITERNVESLQYQHNITALQFRMQFLPELRQEYAILQRNALIPSFNDNVPHLPTYFPKIVLPNIASGPLFKLAFIDHHSFVPHFFHQNIKDYATGVLPMPDWDTVRPTVVQMDRQSYILYMYNFTSHITDWSVTNDLGYGNTFYPCLQLDPTNFTNRLSVEEYLIYQYYLNHNNHEQFDPDINKITNPATLIFNSSLPDFITRPTLPQLDIVGIMQFNAETRETRMFFNKAHYLNSQVNTTASGGNVPFRKYSTAELDALRREYLFNQLATTQPDNYKTVRGAACYLYTPLSRIFPTASGAVKHKLTVLLDHPTDPMLSEVYDAVMLHNYPAYVNNAKLSPPLETPKPGPAAAVLPPHNVTTPDNTTSFFSTLSTWWNGE